MLRPPGQLQYSVGVCLGDGETRIDCSDIAEKSLLAIVHKKIAQKQLFIVNRVRYTTNRLQPLTFALDRNMRPCCLGGTQVEQVDEASGNALAEVTVAVVEAILEPLRPAMIAMRAKVEVRLVPLTSVYMLLS